ncbi:bacillithiol system redox-active protein YtxJ [Paenibacillus sp. KN14-4R]|uniref:bacillithiol system redox-active protein YtxJ n=1 Tax=Paenibacillus sp. KN14-4R TaxID=3445773 RepID=UPI003F9FC7A6
MNYQEITTLEEWNALLQDSEHKGIVIFKHSTTCPVSASAHEEFEQYLEGTPNTDVAYYLVKVIESRPVSNQIAEDLQVKHASPQIIYFEKKHSVWNTSHWSITVKHMTAVLN